MSLLCSLSNEVPDCPVISKISGHVFEKRLIEKHLSTNETDPISGEILTMADLIEIKIPAHIRPKPPNATSIPALIKSLQDEWDAMMLHAFTQKQQIQTLKQEVSHSLYQYDASCRVMARLTKEVTAAREALATLKPQAGVVTHLGHVANTTEPDHEMEVIQNVQQADGMTPEIDRQLLDKSQMLTSERKQRGKTIPEQLAKPQIMQGYTCLSTQTGLHSASVPGILCLDIGPNQRIITGGNDKNAVVYNTGTSEIISVLKGHSKKVTQVVYHYDGEVAITGSADSTIRAWSIPTSQTHHVIRAHTAPITGLSLHATGNYVLSSSVDGHWAFSDINTGHVVLRHLSVNSRSDNTHKLSCMKSHPDGLIAASGADDGELSIWSLREDKKAAFFNHTTSGSITSIAFSENGFYLATGGSDGQIKLWDLRKVREFKTLTPGDGRSYQICDLEFDHSGSYLGVSGSDVTVYLSKQWDSVVNFSDHTALATGIRFGENANSIVTCSIDRTVKLYGSKELCL